MTNRVLLLVAAFFSAVLVGCGERTAPAHVSDYRVFVSNETSGTVSEINPVLNRVVSTISLGKRPRGLQVSPNAKLLVVALSGSPLVPPGVDPATLPSPDKVADGIAIIEISSRRVLEILHGVSDPEQMALDANGARLFVASEDTGKLVVLDVNSGTVVSQIPVGDEPEGVAVSPDGQWAAVTSESDNLVTLVKTNNLTVVRSLRVGRRPRGLAFAPDSSFVYVTNEADGTVGVIQLSSLSVVATIAIPFPGTLPMGIVVTKDGKKLYVTTGRGGRVVEIDAVMRRTMRSVAISGRPWGIALTPDGKILYTANGPTHDVSVIDTATFAEIVRIPVGQRPWGVAVAVIAATKTG